MPINPNTGKEGLEQEGFAQEGAGDVGVSPPVPPIAPPSYTFQVGAAEIGATQVGSGPTIPGAGAGPSSGGAFSVNMEGNMQLLLGGING
jgi:hypothetical protein